MIKKLSGILICIILIVIILPAAASNYSSKDDELDGPHVDFLIGAGVLGWNVVIWNYGNEPAYLIKWEIETQGINGTRVINGHRRGIIPVLRPKDTQYMAPLTLPKTKFIFVT